MFALLRTRRYPEGGVGSSRHIPGERPACWVPWLAQRPWRPLIRPKGPRAPFFIRNGGIDKNNNMLSCSLTLVKVYTLATTVQYMPPRRLHGP